MRLKFFALEAVLLALLGSGEAEELALRAGASLRLVPNTAVQPEGCELHPAPWGGLLRCPAPGSVRLWVEREGYEPLLVEAEAGAEEVVLEETVWTPKPATLLFQPPEQAEGAMLLWPTERGLEKSWVVEGKALGPRLRQEQRVEVLVVGPHCRSARFELGPEARGREVLQQLQPGVSVALQCLPPWGELPVEGCQARLGRLLSFLKGSKRAWSLAPLGNVGSFQGLAVVDLPRPSGQEEKLFLGLRAPGWPPVLTEWSYQTPFQVWPLPQPAELAVLVESDAGKPQQAKVVVAQRAAGLLVELAAQETDGRGKASFTLARGAYVVLAEAAGFSRQEQEVVLGEATRTLTLSLAPAATLRGEVVDAEANPVPDAVVLVLPEAASDDGDITATHVDGAGQFLATLVGEGPWLVRVEAPGYAPAAVPVSPGQRHITVMLARVCSALLHLLGPAGAPVDEPLVMALNAASMEARAGKKEAQGSYRFQLGPGHWVLLAEKSRLTGSLTIPPSCGELELVVQLQPAGAKGFFPPG